MKGVKFKRLRLENKLQYKFMSPVFCNLHLCIVTYTLMKR